MTRLAFLSVFSSLVLSAGCGSDGATDPSCVDGNCDNSFKGVCEVLDLAGSTALECAGAELNSGGLCHNPTTGRFVSKTCCSFGQASGIKRNDQLAARIINEGSSCATTFREVMDSLKQSGCDTVETRVVETSAQHLSAAGLSGTAKTDAMLFGGQVPETGGYHTVTSIECGGSGPENRILFLQSKQFTGEPGTRDAEGGLTKPGVSDSSIWEQNGLRKTMEAIAWDPTGGPIVDGNATGVFNYYALEAEDERESACKTFGDCKTPRWAFHGNSAQFLDLDQDKLEQTGNFFAEKRRCAVCHTGGGLIMRELNSPWINWEEDFDTQGARKLMEVHRDVLGDDLASSSGADQEFTIVGGGNSLWDKQRIVVANSPEAVASPAALLKPLFCSNEINVQSSFGKKVTSIGRDFFFDPILASKTGASLRVSISDSIYQDAIAAEQVIPRLTNGTGATGLDAPFFNVPGFGVIDTAGGFMVPERSGADMKYIKQLESQGILESKFVKAVLAVDFTRPIFSPTRCDILREVDLFWSDVGGTISDGSAVTKAVKAKLEAIKASKSISISVGGQELLDNLESGDAINGRMDAFSAACSERAKTATQAAFVSDVIHVANVTREKAYELPLYQLIPSSMPAGKNFSIGLGRPLRPSSFRPSSGQTSNARFNADDCTLETLAAGK